MTNFKFELFKDGKLVGYEIHKISSYFNVKQMRIFHSKAEGTAGEWDIKEWPERFITHDEKKIIL